MKRIIGGALVTGLLLFCGCSNSTEKQLVGKWQETTHPMGALVFRKNHTGQAFWPGENGRQEMSEMKWSLLKKENKVSVITPPGPVNFEIKPDRLVSPNGVILVKVK